MMNLKKLIVLSTLIVCTTMLSFAQVQMNLLDNLTYSGKTLNDIWGWSNGSNEYALVGLTTGLSVVNVTNPNNVSEVQFQSGINSTWRDIKTWGNYAYVSNESGNGVEIFDLSGLPGSMTNSFWTGNNGVNFQSAHNLFIDEFGILYVFGANYGVGGAIMADVAANPTNPPVLGVYNTRYCHDGYARNNILYTAEINNGLFSIVDVSNKSNTVVLASQQTTNTFTHNTWLSDNGNHLFTTDETGGSEVGSYDISNLNNIQRLDGHFSSLSGGTVPHNTHVLNDCLITSWYTDGVNVVDARDPSLLVEVAYYDTYPQGGGGGFNGCWGAYPFLPSGNILASDQGNGLFVLEGGCPCAVRLTGTITDAGSGNPINGATVTVSGSSGLSTTSNATGYYGSGTPTAGTYTVTYNAPGYAPQTITVNLNNCQTVNQNVQLAIQGACSQGGQILDAASGAPISGAMVIFDDGAGYTATTNTNGSGSYSTSIPMGGGYTVTVGKWGYLSEILTNQTACGNLNIDLEAGYCDDFALDFGWTATSNGASTGFWERGEPIGTTYYGQSNPEVDVNNDNGNQCYVTGNGGGGAGDDDIDGGEVILTSPVFNLTNYTDPYIDYDRWFFNDGGAGSAPNDQLVVEITNGGAWVNVETITDGNQESQWVNNNFRVLNYTTLSANMQLRFRASDTGDGHLVEAGVDDFCVEGTTTSCPTIPINFNLQATTSAASPVNLSASPAGGTFSGPGVILNGFNPSIVGPGQYDITYTYTDANGCTGTATESIIVFMITFNFVTYNLGTISPKILSEINESLTTYPNPVVSDLEFNFYTSEQIEEGINYSIYDIYGKKMLEETLYVNDHYHQQKVDMTNFNKGVYLMQISNSAGVITKRIVKQ